MIKRLILIVFFIVIFTINSIAETVTISWEHPTENYDIISGYRLYASQQSKVYPSDPLLDNISRDVTDTSFDTEILPRGKSFFVMTSFNEDTESKYSEEVSLINGTFGLSSPSSFKIKIEITQE